MPIIQFSHPKLRVPLVVDTGVNEITWSYNLNVQTYPTYAGEVVQILSAFIDNISVIGDIRTYTDMERIYGWFLDYIQIATQGADPGGLSYQEDPVTMVYAERNWTIDIHPISLPGFRMATDVVVPQWQVQAAVAKQPAGDDLIMVSTIAQAEAILGKDTGFLTLSGNIGFDESNPFSDPAARPANTDGAMPTLNQEFTALSDWYNSLVPAYLQKDFTSILGAAQSASGPAVSTTDSTTDSKTTKTVAKKK